MPESILAHIINLGKPDSYVVFTLNGQVVYQSQVKEKTLHPEWNETFSVIIVGCTLGY